MPSSAQDAPATVPYMPFPPDELIFQQQQLHHTLTPPVPPETSYSARKPPGKQIYTGETQAHGFTECEIEIKQRL